jgi:UDP-glucose 4-epimerase
VKHALITGGAGFIGSHLAETLIARDYRVTIVDDESTGTVENLAAVSGHFNFSFVHGTVADKPLVRSLLNDVDEVYHLAAAVGVQLISTAPIHTIETNIYPTEALLRLAHDRGIRRVRLNAQSRAVGFYQRHGFVAEGQEFIEAGIAHRAMWRDVN